MSTDYGLGKNKASFRAAIKRGLARVMQSPTAALAPSPLEIATEADIRAAYRLLLGREPDDAGLRLHLKWATAQATKPTVLAEHFMGSDEYRARILDGRELVPVDMDGYVVFVRRGDQLIGANIIAGHEYEPYVGRVFERTLRDGATVLDVGANVGLYAMRAAARVGSSGKVIAVEPLPQNHQALYSGIVRNGFSNVDVLPFAASDKRGLISVICASDSSNGIVSVRDPGSSTEMYVPTRRLDEELSSLSRLDVVKIDIEGHEPVAWKGMRSLLEKHRPHVFTEFSPMAMQNLRQDPFEYLGMLFAYDERVLVLHRDTEAVECRDSASVMEQWESANRRAALGGELHLDLYIQSLRTVS